MSIREREGLVARIRQIRRTPERGGESSTAGSVVTEQDKVPALEARVEHLEQLVQGLQDSVHRESSRQAKRISELEARIEPSALGQALSKDARDRGL